MDKLQLPEHPSHREEAFHIPSADNLVRVVLRNVYAHMAHEDLMTTHMEVRITISDDKADWIAVPGSMYRAGGYLSAQETRDKAASRFHGEWAAELLKAGAQDRAWAAQAERHLKMAAARTGSQWEGNPKIAPQVPLEIPAAHRGATFPECDECGACCWYSVGANLSDGDCKGRVRPVYREANPVFSVSVHACEAHRALAREKMKSDGQKPTRSHFSSERERRAHESDLRLQSPRCRTCNRFFLTKKSKKSKEQNC